tara:strand:+ start:722 stop:1057 length:336 start_codon:yes stop_codon:yes gene_type:complete
MKKNKFANKHGFANKHSYSDCEPYEVVEVINDKKMVIREMDCTELPWKKDWHEGGFAGHISNQHKQKWKIESNDKNHKFFIRKHKSGAWKDAGGNKYQLDSEPVKFYDFNF